MNIDRLRQRADQRLWEIEALAVFTHQLGEKNASEISKAREDIATKGPKRLREILEMAEGHIAWLRERSGFAGDISLLIELVKDARGKSPIILTFPKWHLDHLFRSYGNCFPGWDEYPPHVGIPIDGSGDMQRAIWHGIYLPEAILYEDMCASYNLAKRSHGKRYEPTTSKVDIKAHDMAVRSAILAAYYFVEAYLNAVAFDYWSREQSNLKQEQIDLLLEWDSKKQRQRWLSFEEKTNRYPRTILGLEHCPLAASNCEELRYLLSTGKKIRDSIVHASPKVDPATDRIDKLSHMLGANLSHATTTVDASIGYVRRLNGILGSYGYDLDWMIDRDPSGEFPDSAFG
jgi:hypothetical protein